MSEIPPAYQGDFRCPQCGGAVSHYRFFTLEGVLIKTYHCPRCGDVVAQPGAEPAPRVEKPTGEIRNNAPERQGGAEHITARVGDRTTQ